MSYFEPLVLALLFALSASYEKDQRRLFWPQSAAAVVWTIVAAVKIFTSLISL